jgi:hypothetical protein
VTRRKALLVLQTVGIALTLADAASGQSVGPSGIGLRFVPVTPCRVADTRGTARPFGGPTMAAGSTRLFVIPQSACGIPPTAQAYSLNVTVVPEGTLAYLTLWPTGQAQPFVSTLNSWTGAVVANAAIVPAGSSGAVSVYVTDTTDVILDINGYFDVPGAANSFSFYAVTPCRAVDTRNAIAQFGGPSMFAGQNRDFPLGSGPCGIPDSASAYSLNATVVPDGPLSYLTMWPTGQARPLVSTLNSWGGNVVANAAIVPAGSNESVSVFVTNPTDVVLDVDGYFAPPGRWGAMSFYPVSPCRVADTRNPAGPFGGPEMGAGEARWFAIAASGCNIPSTAAAYSLNVTAVPDGPLSYLSAWPAGASQPFVSTLNSWQGTVVANAAIVPASGSGAVSIFVTNPTHVILDINGYFALDTPASAANLAVVSEIPANGTTGVALDATVSVQFSGAVDPATVNTTTVTLSATFGNVPCRVTYDPVSQMVNLVPLGLLTPTTTYTVTVSRAVTDPTGAPLGTDHQWSFTTQAPLAAAANVSAPPGINPTGLTIVSYRGHESTPDVSGNFTAVINPVGTSAVAAMTPGKSFGLLAFAVSQSVNSRARANSAVSRALVRSHALAGSSPVYVTPHQVTASANAASSSNTVTVDFETTAESMIFAMPYLTASDPARAAAIMATIAADPKTRVLANALKAAWNETDPLSDAAVQSALLDAITSVLATLTSAPTAHVAEPARVTAEEQAASTAATAIAVTPRCDRSTLSNGLQCLDLDYFNVDASGTSADGSYTIMLDNQNCGELHTWLRLVGCSVDWVVLVGPVTTSPAGGVTSVSGGTGSSGPDSPPSSVVGTNCSLLGCTSLLYVAGHSLFDDLDVADLVGKALANAMGSVLVSSANSLRVSSTQTGDYVVRAYSGSGPTDSVEFSALLNGNYDQGRLLWGAALAGNALRSGIKVLEAAKLIPGKAESCVFEGVADGASAVLDFYDLGTSKFSSSEAFVLAFDNIVGNALGKVSSAVDACTQTSGGGSWTSAAGWLGEIEQAAMAAAEKVVEGLDIVASIGDLGDTAQRVAELVGAATPVETAIIHVGTPAAQPPTVTGINPSPVPGLDGKQPVTISGTGFVKGATINWQDLTGGGSGTNYPISVSSATIIASMNFTNQTATWQIRVVNPDGTASNWYQFAVQASSTAKADLVPQDVASAGSATAGGALTVSLTMANRGSVAAGATTTQIRLSTSATSTGTTDVILGDISTAAVPAGSSIPLGLTVTIPSGIAAGTYYVWAVADILNQVPQTSTSNDFAHSSGLTVTAAPGAPSLTLYSTTPASPTPGQQFIINLSGNNFNPTTAQILFSGPGCAPCMVPNGALSTRATTLLIGPVTLNAAGAYPVSVQNGAGGAVSNALGLTIASPGASLTGVVINPTTVAGGGQATITVSLSGPAPSPAGAAVTLTSSSPAAFPPPSTLVVPPGQTSASTTISAGAVGSSATVTLNASYNGSSRTATVTVTPATGLALGSASITPASLASGAFATLSVTLTGTAPGGGITVSIQSSNPTAFPAPSSIAIPAGASTNGVSVQAGAVAASMTVTVTATYNGSSQTANVTVTPAGNNQVSVTPGNWQPQFTVGDSSATLPLQISSKSGGTLTGTVTASTANGQPWLTVNGHSSDTWVAPAGISMTANPAGLAAGIYSGSVTVTAPAASNSPVTVPVTMTIRTPLQITTTSLPTATWGSTYSFQLQASGGSGYVWSLEDGNLPVGLTLSASGLVSGSLPMASSNGAYTFTVLVQDSASRSAFKQLTINVQPPITVATNAPGSFQFSVGVTYVQPPNGGNSISFFATGGVSPYAWAATGLPPGLRIDAASGYIVGTPTQPGTFAATITATDSHGRTGSGAFSLVVVAAPLLITPTSLPSGTVGVAYSQYLNASGGSNAGYQWTVQGSLPPGLIGQVNPGASCTSSCSYQIAGTPTQAGTFTFTVQVKDSLNIAAQQSLSIIINSGTPPQITSTTLPRATVGQAYTPFTFAATGGSGTGYQWSFLGSGPDPGLQLSAGGVMSGTSTIANDCSYTWGTPVSFQVKVTDSASQSSSKQFCLTAFYPTPQITGVNPSGVVADGQSHAIAITGNNIRSTAQLYTGATLLPTTFNGGALSLVLTPGGAGVLGPLNEGTFALRIVQAFSDGSNTDRTLSIYDPVPTVSSVTAVLNNSSQACTVNQNCQLVVIGGGLMYGTTYTIVQAGTNLGRAVYPPTPVPWNTITTSAFSLGTAGTYTLQITNGSQPGGGSASVTAQFNVAP